jgi:hypothetical protein
MSGKALAYTRLLRIKTTIDQIQNSKSHYFIQKKFIIELVNISLI